MKNIENEILELTQKLNSANQLYYHGKETGLSDQDFDESMKRLEELETENPQLKASNSPTLRVGSDLKSDFKKIAHRFPMLSIANTYNFQELQDFDRQLTEGLEQENNELVAEMKIDGVSLSIHYKNGAFDYAVTRGDGSHGDDVSTNVKQILDIPLHIENAPDTFEVRGEIYMKDADFQALNERLLSEDKPAMQNPRNCAAGTIKMKDPKEVRRRKLHFFAFSSLGSDSPTHSENLSNLKNYGFPVNQYLQSDTLEDVFQFCELWETKKQELDFDIDGMVIKLNNIAQQNQLGNTAKAPRWAVAWKFTAEQAQSEILSIDLQIGRTGVVTPVANLSPISLNGTTVKRATLHNFEEIERLDLRIGDQVMIEKGGEIIPKVAEVLHDLRKEDLEAYSIPTECPNCQTLLIQLEGEVALRCDNIQCSAQVQRYLEHFVSRTAMNIDSIGPSLLEQLIKSELVKTPVDLFRLTEEKLLTLERMAEKSAKNVLYSLEQAKENSFEHLLHGLGIRHIGRTAAKNLAKSFESLEKLQSQTLEDLEKIPDIGFKMAESLVEYFSNTYNQDLLFDLENNGVNLSYKAEAGTSNLFSGKIFVLTGTLPTLKREQARLMIENAGGKVSSSVSKKTSFVLAGEAGGSKLIKAEKLEIDILTEEAFLEMVQGNSEVEE